MSTHTLYLDAIIVGAAAYPSGFGYSLYTSWSGTPRHASSALLATLVLPFALVIPAVYPFHPELAALTRPTLPWVAAAVFLVPLALVCESLVQGAAIRRATGRFPRGVSVHSFWQEGVTPIGHVLLALIAAGEEVFYRSIWIGLLTSAGVAAPAAVAISSTAYGLNHLSFGFPLVVSKIATGFLYGAIYIAGGYCLVLPLITHVLQNLAVLELVRRHDG